MIEEWKAGARTASEALAAWIVGLLHAALVALGLEARQHGRVQSAVARVYLCALLLEPAPLQAFRPEQDGTGFL
jgi:predicted carbohydrate-binding protein with CBM5 and CBM33 domain